LYRLRRTALLNHPAAALVVRVHRLKIDSAAPQRHVNGANLHRLRSH